MAMRQLKGVTMYRTAGVIVAAVLLSTESGNLPGNAVSFLSSAMSGESHATVDQRAPIDIAALIAQARGAPPLICSLASQGLRSFGWGDWSDAPSTPLAVPMGRDYDFGPEELPVTDVNRLLEALSTEDPCVREISVRILGRQRGDLVVTGLVSRLGAADPGLREVAALGLGLTHSPKAEDPLIRALRDATPGVRANSAWALGRLES